jgi:transposase
MLVSLPLQWFWVLASVDGRMGLDRLLAYLMGMGVDARDGAGYVFSNRAGNRLRVLVVDTTGVWLCHRRLHKGSFFRPKVGDPKLSLSTEQMRWLCMGVDWQRLSTKDVPMLL